MPYLAETVRAMRVESFANDALVGAFTHGVRYAIISLWDQILAMKPHNEFQSLYFPVPYVRYVYQT